MSSAELAHQVLVEHADDFVKSRGLGKIARPMLGDGLLTSEHELHRRQRKLIAPAFSHRRIGAYATTMADLTERAQAALHDGAVVDVALEMMRLTLAIVGKTLFDADVAGEADDVGAAITAANHYVSEAGDAAADAHVAAAQAATAMPAAPSPPSTPSSIGSSPRAAPPASISAMSCRRW